MSPRGLLAVALGCLVPLAGAFGQSPVVDGTASDVWILSETGELRASYGLGGLWTRDVSTPATGQAEVLYDGGSTILNGVDATSRVLVNQVAGSLPAPSSGLPDVSLVGLGRASNVLGGWGEPALTITPAGGTFSETVAVTLRGYPPPEAPSAVVDLHWRIDGGPEQVAPAARQHRLFLYRNGVTVIEAWARAGGLESTHETSSFTLAAVGDPLRDSDGDGIPDAVEIERGTQDPLDADGRLDTDGDGWTDFEEHVRGSDPDDDTSVPADTDGDGWSDWDEARRGTDPDHVLPAPFGHLSSRPRVRSRDEAEYLLSGLLYEDAQETTSRGGWDDLYAATPAGASAWDQRGLPSAADLAAAGLAFADLPPSFRAPHVEAELAAGRVPPLRVPAGAPLVISARAIPEPGLPTFEGWTVKAWVPALSRVTPHGVIPWATAQGLTLSTVADWEAAYAAYLDARLVQPAAVALSPASGVGIALVEGAVAHFSPSESDEVAVLLGEPDAEPADTAVAALQETMQRAVPGRSLDVLHTDLTLLGQPGGVLAGFAAGVQALYTADPATFAPGTTTRAAAALLQGDPGDDDPLARYLARMLVVVELAGLSPAERALLLDIGGDFDVDGIPNAQEREPPPEAALSPILADSDGDFIPDALDPCPASADPLCPSLALQTADGDGDGIVDAIDNCKGTANPGQQDTTSADGMPPDGIGDACALLANIVVPTTDLRIYAGAEVSFRALASAPRPAFSSSIVMRWKVDGVEQTVGPAVTVRFATPGAHTVELAASRLIPSASSVDTRTVEVLGSLPAVDANGPYTVVEGEPAILTATATTPHAGPVSHRWTFGDGASGSGESASHVWADDDIYVAEVTFTDALGLEATDSASVSVSDSVPLVDFRADPSPETGPSVVTFTDLSTAHDGIAARTWDFGDGSGLAVGPVAQHGYASAGVFDVELTVTDGDGSIESLVLPVEVRPEPIAIPMLPPLALAALASVLLGWGTRRGTKPPPVTR